MISRKFRHVFVRRPFFKLAVIGLLACAVLIAYARTSKKPPAAFALAAELPRGALVYAQFRDLPELIKRWDESKLKERYLTSTNFQQFQNRHLALKLIERWEEFNSAVGFPLDALTVSETAENKAALAVYDIGRLEMVFVAPIGDEKLAAAKFFQNTDQFEETELPDGTVYYSKDIDADRGRQQQKFAFASLRGRVVLATSEQLLLRTLANINGKSRNDSLSDDPSFKNLALEVTPHFLTIWTDQSKLNSDWYFKQYWVMRNVEQLKNIRACMLDLELRDDKWVERRNFLLSGQLAAKNRGIPAAVAKRILAFVPADSPYLKLRVLNEGTTAAAIVRDTLMDRSPEEGKGAKNSSWSWQSYDDSEFYPGGGGESWDDGSYYSLDPRFDSMIDDPGDAKVENEDESAHGRLRREAERHSLEGLRDSIEQARPLYAATVESPRVFNGPLFAEFRRGAVIALQSPGEFRPSVFEGAVTRLAESRLMISGSSTRLMWAGIACGQQQCRELKLPALGWGVSYALRGRELIIANSPELLEAMLKGGNSSQIDPKSSSTIHDLTVIRLNQREKVFDPLMRKLDAPRVKAYWDERKKENGEGAGPSREFFSGNMASLLGVAAPVIEIRIKRSLRPNRLREEVEYILK